MTYLVQVFKPAGEARSYKDGTQQEVRPVYATVIKGRAHMKLHVRMAYKSFPGCFITIDQFRGI